MSETTTITGPFGTLRREQEVIAYSTWGGPVADERWRHVDKQGHEHYWADGYPTLLWVVDDRWYDPDDNETYENGHWECPRCGEHVRPGTRRVPPSTHRHAGEAAWFLNDEPVSEEEARALVEDAQAARPMAPAAPMPVYALGEREPAAFIQPDGTFDRDTDTLPRAMFADVPVHLHLSADITLAPLRMANDQTGPVGTFERAHNEWMRA